MSVNNFTSFKQARRTAFPIKLALQGISFSGKTMSAIKVAKGLANGKPVCLIDTENGSAAMYDHLNFMHATIEPPFKPDKYIALIREAVEAGAGAVVIDSLSHAWSYILDFKDSLDQAGGKGAQWSNWAKAKPLWASLKDAILQSPVHVICTFREKAEYVVESNENGGNRTSTVKKLGTKAVAEEGSEYEFSTVWKLDKDTHIARVEKDRTGLWDGRVKMLDEGDGREILMWISNGDPDFVLQAGPEWQLLATGFSQEFSESLEDADRQLRDRAKTVISRVKLSKEVNSALLRSCKERSQDYMALVIDADRYGANNAERLIRFVCDKIGMDPVNFTRLQLGQEQTQLAQQVTSKPAEPAPLSPSTVSPEIFRTNLYALVKQDPEGKSVVVRQLIERGQELGWITADGIWIGEVETSTESGQAQEPAQEQTGLVLRIEENPETKQADSDEIKAEALAKLQTFCTENTLPAFTPDSTEMAYRTFAAKIIKRGKIGAEIQELTGPEWLIILEALRIEIPASIKILQEKK